MSSKAFDDVTFVIAVGLGVREVTRPINAQCGGKQEKRVCFFVYKGRKGYLLSCDDDGNYDDGSKVNLPVKRLPTSYTFKRPREMEY